MSSGAPETSPQCRLCLAEEGYMYDIFSSDILPDICLKVEKYSDVKICVEDDLTHNVCDSCVEELKLIDKFVVKCRHSNETLMVKINIKVEEKAEPPSDNENPWMYISDKEDIPIIKLEKDTISVNIDTEKVTKKRHKTKRIINKKVKHREKGLSWICPVCNLHARSPSALKAHSVVHSEEKPYECNVCLTRFKHNTSLLVHKVRRHGDNSMNGKYCKDKIEIFCETCGKPFKSKTHLKIHLRTHNNERPYNCDMCDKRFTQLAALTVHLRRHRGERPYSCDICQKTFVESSHLKRHSSVHSDARPYICNLCGKAVKSPFALKQHLKLHSNSKEHVCDKCGMSFTIKGSLSTHMKIIHSEKSGQCVVCHKVCSNLNEHMTRHNGEKPHCCEVCNKRFSRKIGLILHSKQHTQNGKYECTLPGCGKTFCAQWVLACHVLKHTGNTPFVCKLCKKGFVRACHLTKHMNINHPNN